MKLKEIIKRFNKEDRIFKLTTICSLSLNLFIGIGKWILAIFSGVVFFVSGVVNILMGVAKLISYIGLLNNDSDFKKRNFVVSFLVFLSGAEYFIYMLNVYLGNFSLSAYEMQIALLIALVSFIEIGVAIYGLVKIKGRGHSFKNIKLINFVLALEAMVLTETAILSFTESVTFASSSLFGLIIGIFVMVLSLFMFLSPFITITNQEQNDFLLIQKSKNNLIKEEGSLTLAKSFIYGNYVYLYKFNGEVVSGNIIKEDGFWKKTHLLIKIILIVLSEILIFAWLIGRFIYFLRCIFLIKKLQKVMIGNGFIVVK